MQYHYIRRNYGDSMFGVNRSTDFYGQAGVAGDVELYAMAKDSAGNVVAEAAQETLDGRCTELAHGAAGNADRVMVVLGAGEAVHGGALHCGELADDAGPQEQLDCPVHGGAADGGQLCDDLLRREALLLVLKHAGDSLARGRDPVALVLQGCDEIRAVGLHLVHGIVYRLGRDPERRMVK